MNLTLWGYRSFCKYIYFLTGFVKIWQGDIANEAAEAGSPGIAFMRVADDGVSIDAAKPIREGVDENSIAAIIAKTGAQPVSYRRQSVHSSARDGDKINSLAHS